MKRRSRALGTWLIGLGLAASPALAEEVVPAEAASPAATPAAGVPNLFAELLIVRPTIDDTAFVLRSPGSTTFPNGTRESDEFDYEAGFRIGAGYEIAESGRKVELSYSRLEADATETINGDFLWATVGNPDFAGSFTNYAGSAAARIDADYQRIDLHVTQPWRVAGAELGLEFGLEWADFRVGERYVFVNDTAPNTGVVSAASRSWGIGPEIGLGLGFEICHACGIPGAFSLAAGSSIALLLTDTNTRASTVSSGAPALSVRDEETSRVIPAIHARAGFTYAVPVAEHVAATASVGYQIDTYLNGLTRAAFVDDVAPSLSATHEYDFDLHGIYASVGVVF